MSALYRSLPKVDVLLESPSLKGLPRHLVVHHARLELAALREGIRKGRVDQVGDVAAAVRTRIETQLQLRQVDVINATGILVHTNLGRAPWAAEVRSAASRAMGYTNLEMDLDSGRRGGRLAGIAEHLCFPTCAEDAIAVNNGAAALLLAVTAIAHQREVVVSR